MSFASNPSRVSVGEWLARRVLCFCCKRMRNTLCLEEPRPRLGTLVVFSFVEVVLNFQFIQ